MNDYALQAEEEMWEAIASQEPSLADLERQALKAANWRGHTMSPYERDSSHQSHTTCTKCGRGAYCDTRPPANGIDIHGEAVALNCTS